MTRPWRTKCEFEEVFLQLPLVRCWPPESLCGFSTFSNGVPRKGGPMIRIRIQYDKYNRTFKLLDNEFGSLLDDGDVYELPVSLCEPCPNDDLFISRSQRAPADVELAGSCKKAH
jgi:hypothetical protein